MHLVKGHKKDDNVFMIYVNEPITSRDSKVVSRDNLKVTESKIKIDFVYTYEPKMSQM